MQRPSITVLIASFAGFAFLVVTAHGGLIGKAGRSGRISPTSMRPAPTCSKANSERY
jgi:hypothetical protein